MAILNYCCCWRSVRKGSFASAAYTLVYFSITVIILLFEYEPGPESSDKEVHTQSFIDPHKSPIYLAFTVAVLCCSSCGVLATFLLLYGLFKDNRIFLVPWILVIVASTLIDLSHCLYLLVEPLVPKAPSTDGAESKDDQNFIPVTPILFTIDFFIFVLNIYSLLCVVSQYQEYKAGRGTARDDVEQRLPTVVYNAKPTTTSFCSTRRAVTYHETRATPTQSPTAPHLPALVPEEPPPVHRQPSKKHVQFPDKKSEPWTVEVKRTVDTAPLLPTPQPLTPSPTS